VVLAQGGRGGADKKKAQAAELLGLFAFGGDCVRFHCSAPIGLPHKKAFTYQLVAKALDLVGLA
jgi:hypothetical protein